MFCALIVTCLGHDEYKMREAASNVCKAPEFEPYLRRALASSECPEVRLRAGDIVRRIDAKRENDLFVNDPETYYRRWIANRANNYYVSDERIIRDVQSNPKRQELITKLSNELGLADPGAWTRPGYQDYDHQRLAQFRIFLNKGQ